MVSKHGTKPIAGVQVTEASVDDIQTISNINCFSNCFVRVIKLIIPDDFFTITLPIMEGPFRGRPMVLRKFLQYFGAPRESVDFKGKKRRLALVSIYGGFSK